MIEIVTGNLLKADAEALVNTVNCVGVNAPERSLAASSVIVR